MSLYVLFTWLIFTGRRKVIEKASFQTITGFIPLFDTSFDVKQSILTHTRSKVERVAPFGDLAKLHSQ